MQSNLDKLTQIVCVYPTYIMIVNNKQNTKTPYQLFEEHFRIKFLKAVFREKFSGRNNQGIDRINGAQFKKQAVEQIRIIKRKCLNGTYRFAPYLELLQSKGRGRNPRVLSVPTIRDRIVLHSLKEILFYIFPECVQRKLASTYIHEIKDLTSNIDFSNYVAVKTDIENFYGSIDKSILLQKLRVKIKSRRILSLITKAIESPTVPQNYHRKDFYNYKQIALQSGIPQGLSISNILASIYLKELDESFNNQSEIIYYRYVDDILIFTRKEQLPETLASLENELKCLKLEQNQDKTSVVSATERFSFLGYQFELPKVTVKEANVEKFIQSIAAKFSTYVHSRESRAKHLKRDFKYNVEDMKSIFVFNLNEKIAGAIYDNQKYGWIFYFSEVNDVSIFFKIDKVIAKMFERLEDFGGKPPSDLKKMSRAFYEAKYNPRGGYVHDYDRYQTIQDKMTFLRKMGKIHKTKAYKEEKIDQLFERFKWQNLAQLLKDDSFIY